MFCYVVLLTFFALISRTERTFAMDKNMRNALIGSLLSNGWTLCSASVTNILLFCNKYRALDANNTYTDNMSCWGYFGWCNGLLRKNIPITLSSFTKHTHCSTNLLPVSLYITWWQEEQGRRVPLCRTSLLHFSWTTRRKS